MQFIRIPDSKIWPPPLDFSGTLDIFTIPDIYHKDPLPQDFYETIYYFYYSRYVPSNFCIWTMNLIVPSIVKFIINHKYLKCKIIQNLLITPHPLKCGISFVLGNLELNFHPHSDPPFPHVKNLDRQPAQNHPSPWFGQGVPKYNLFFFSLWTHGKR